MELELYKCHRSFLESYIKKHRLSFKSLENAINKSASSATLSRIIKKNPDQNFTKAFNVNLEVWIEVVSQLKITQPQMAQAILLRVIDGLKNSVNPKSKLTSRLIKTAKNDIIYKRVDSNNLSEESLYIADTYDKLPKRFQQSVATEAFKVIGYLEDINPVKSQTLKQNKKIMKRIIN